MINEIDWEARNANFRICIFDKKEWNHGIGYWAVCQMRDFAFEALELHRLSLSVFSYNPRAEYVYQKAGFKKEGILRDVIKDGTQYASEILMSLLEDEWQAIKRNSQQ